MNHTLYNTVKQQTNIKGYWKDKDGKVFIDNIIVIKYTNKKAFRLAKKILFNEGEEAVFYRYGNQGIIESREGIKTTLSKRIESKHKKGYDTVKIIKDLLEQYGGCTVYNKKGHVLIEVYTN